MQITQCSMCRVRVVMKPDGTCPSCGSQIQLAGDWRQSAKQIKPGLLLDSEAPDPSQPVDEVVDAEPILLDEADLRHESSAVATESQPDRSLQADLEQMPDFDAIASIDTRQSDSSVLLQRSMDRALRSLKTCGIVSIIFAFLHTGLGIVALVVGLFEARNAARGLKVTRSLTPSEHAIRRSRLRNGYFLLLTAVVLNLTVGTLTFLAAERRAREARQFYNDVIREIED